MNRILVVILVGVFSQSQLVAQAIDGNAPQDESEAYVIKVGIVTYDRSLSHRAIQDFRQELEQSGLKDHSYQEVVNLAYELKAKEVGRIEMTFILRPGQQLKQEIKSVESEAYARVQLMEANEANVTASIQTMASGKFVSRKGNASTQNNSARQVIPLNDEELFTSSSSSFTHFPNGGGLGDTRRQYVRARVATLEDFAKPETGRQQLGVPAQPPGQSPKFLVFDEQWTYLRLATPDEYNQYSMIDRIEPVLKDQARQELKRVSEICQLDENQKEKLEAALLRERVQLQRKAFALEEKTLRNPRPAGGDAKQIRTEVAELNDSLQQSHLSEGGFTNLIMRSQLNDAQLKKLERATLEGFVESLAGSDLNWSKEQSAEIQNRLKELIDESETVVLDQQVLLDALTDEFLAETLDPKQVNRFSVNRRSSDRAHYFLLNLQ